MATVRNIEGPSGRGEEWTIMFDDGGVITTAKVMEAPIIGAHPQQRDWYNRSLWWVRLHKEGQERTYYIVEKPVAGNEVQLWDLRTGDSQSVSLWKSLAVAVVGQDDFRH